MPVTLGRQCGQRQRHGDGGGEAGHVDPVDGRHPAAGEQQAAERRADDERELQEELAQHVGRGKRVPGDEVHHDRGARRAVGAGEAGADSRQHEDRPQRRLAAQAVQGKTHAAQRHRELGHDEHLAAVDGVGHRAAEQRPDERRPKLCEAHQADVERRAGEQVDLVEDGHQGELRADLRHREAEPEAPELREAAQRPEVDEGQSPHAAPPSPPPEADLITQPMKRRS